MRERLGIVLFIALCLTPIVGGLLASWPAARKEIEIVGVLSAVGGSDSGGDVIDTYTFDDGRTYSMDFHGVRRVDAEGGWANFPEAGDLLIAGSKPSYWLLYASPSFTTAGCPEGSFGIPNLNGNRTETTVELDFGVTLQNAPEYDPSASLGRFHAQSLICLDRRGQVLKLIG